VTQIELDRITLVKDGIKHIVPLKG